MEKTAPTPLIRPSATFSPQAGRRRCGTLSPVCPSPRFNGEKVAEGRMRGSARITGFSSFPTKDMHPWQA
jgi:hypothetical protein